jgi:hypothetical protein
MTFSTMIKKPSAFLPVAMSFAALATVLIHITIFGIVREADEGTAAHIFQLLMIAEVPIMAFFVIKWLPRFPRQALLVLALQVGAVFTQHWPPFSFSTFEPIHCWKGNHGKLERAAAENISATALSVIECQ